MLTILEGLVLFIAIIVLIMMIGIFVISVNLSEILRRMKL